MEFVSIALVLFLIMDPLGNVPIFLSVLKNIDPQRHLKIVFRELVIAYIILLIYLFAGQYILDLLALTQEAIGISGGIILFLIALRMIFPPVDGMFGEGQKGPTEQADEPMIVPLAIPAVAGPSTMAVLMLMTTSHGVWTMFMAVTLAWICTAGILLTSTPLHRVLGKKGLTAFERLMGMILVMMSVQMMLNAIQSFNLGSSG